jgi:hypothetical protein
MFEIPSLVLWNLREGVEEGFVARISRVYPGDATNFADSHTSNEHFYERPRRSQKLRMNNNSANKQYVKALRYAQTCKSTMLADLP